MTSHTSDITNTYYSKHLMSVVLLFLVYVHVVAGYIINENGKLVPFKVYKKGNHGSRVMCFLHPRNCRGGFHKRVFTEPSADIGSLFTDPVYKRKFEIMERNAPTKTQYQITDDVMVKPRMESRPTDEVEGIDMAPALKPQQIQEDIFSIATLENRKTLQNKPKLSVIKDNMDMLADMKVANMLFSDLTKEFQKVGDPPPIEKPNQVKAKIEEYPAYGIWPQYEASVRNNEQESQDEMEVFFPLEPVNYLQ